LQIVESRAEDVPLLVDQLNVKGMNAIGLTSEDSLLEYQLGKRAFCGIVQRIPVYDGKALFGKPVVSLLGPTNRKRVEKPIVAVNSRYENIAQQYLAKQNYSARIITTSGCTETFVRFGLADLVIDSICTGKAMQEANLIVYERIWGGGPVLIGRVTKRPLPGEPEVGCCPQSRDPG
jgi:ATP phosphoribosyltransferase